MAKVKSSGLRNYVGRLGGSVYYMLKGQNIAREKAPEVSNPRTATQMRQRMQWANLVAMYKCLQPYLGKKAFQNKLATWSDYNAFMSANLGSTPVYLTKESVQNGVTYLAPYKVTEGSLPAINTALSTDGANFETSIWLSEEISIATTIGKLSELIIDHNTGWQNGDQLGIVILQNGRMYRPYTQAFEIILDRSDERTIQDVIPYSDEFLTTNEARNLMIDPSVIENPTQGLAVACAVIHSRTISGKTSVSTQSLVLNRSAQSDYDEHITEDAFNAARESYGLPTEVWLDAGYQGTSGGAVLPNTITSISGSYEIDDQGALGSFTLTDGGENALAASASDAPDTYTRLTVHLRKTLESGQEYNLSFLPDGDPDNAITSNASDSDGTTTFRCFFTRDQALQIENTPGIFALCKNDLYDVQNLVAEIEVVAP